MNALKAGYGVIQCDMMSLTNAIEKFWWPRFEDSRKTNWPLLVLCAGLLPMTIARLLFYYVKYFTTGAISPIKSEIVQIENIFHTMSEQMHDMSAIQAARGKDISKLMRPPM